jgi:hypothetical protein
MSNDYNSAIYTCNCIIQMAEILSFDKLIHALLIATFFKIGQHNISMPKAIPSNNHF